MDQNTNSFVNSSKPTIERANDPAHATLASSQHGQPPLSQHGRTPSSQHGLPPQSQHGRPPPSQHGRPPTSQHGRPPSRYIYICLIMYLLRVLVFFRPNPTLF